MNARQYFACFCALVLSSWLPLQLTGAESTITKVDPKSANSPVNYVIQPGDVIRVQVFQEDDINKQTEALSVSREATVTLPLISSIDVKGKTTQEAGELIRSLYDKDYLVNPQVTVTVVKYVERNVQVFGSVNKPGNVQFPPEQGLTLLSAIIRADGFSRLADKKHVRLTRADADGKTQTMTVDVDGILKGGPGDVTLQPNDTIDVPERIL
jgi:polysaccharide export outer membrane protein